MENSTIQKIILLIKNNGSITELLKDGYSYGQIANMINQLVKEKYIKYRQDKFTLMAKSEKLLNSQTPKNNKKGIERWVLPDLKNKNLENQNNELYLPSRNELHF